MTSTIQQSEISNGKKSNVQAYEKKISNISLVIVRISGLLMLIGLILSVIQGIELNSDDLNINRFLHDIVHLSPLGLIYVGIFILIMSPVLRVIISIRLYVLIKDDNMAIVTTFVLVIMLIGIIVVWF